jgi:hypothetical protein
MNGHTDWVPILLRYNDGTVLPAVWGSGDPDTIPDELFEIPDELLECFNDSSAREILEPPNEAQNHAKALAPFDKTVPESMQRSRLANRFKLLTLDEIAQLPPPEWLIADLVPKDGLVMLYGEPNVGKSFLALDWALSVAEGVPCLGHDVQQGEVVYIYAEGVRGLHQRAEAWLKAHDRTGSPLFRALPLSVTIPDADERREFVKAVRAESKHPRLIVIDTLARNFGTGNESLAQDMNSFVSGCDELRAEFPGATVLVVHHSGKDPNRGARGSLALQGATDAVFALIKSSGRLSLTNEKQKDGEEASPISLELVRVNLSDGKTSCVVQSVNAAPIGIGVPPTAPRKDPRTIKTDAGTLQALAAFGPGGATLAQWEQAVDRANDTFYRSRDRLVAGGKVVHDAENARYVAATPSTGPGPGSVQDGSNTLEVQKVSPEVPP